MAIRRPVSDSLSRCDPQTYSNLYDVRVRPPVKQDAVSSTQLIQKDTLEMSRDHLKKEALHRLRHTSKYLIFQAGFMRVGKYLFLAVAFPPYLLIYGIPKWLILQGLPALVSMCQIVAKKIEQKVKKRLEVVKQKMRQMVLVIQQQIQHLISPIRRLAQDIRQAFQRMGQTTLLWMKRVTQLIKVKNDLSKKMINRLREKLNRSKEKLSPVISRIQKGKKSIQEWATQQKLALTHILQARLNGVHQLPQWSLGQLQRLSNRAHTWSQPLQKRVMRSQERAHQAQVWLMKQYQKGWQKSEKALQPLLDIYRQFLKPFWQRIQQNGQKKAAKGREFFNQKRQRALQFLEQSQERLRKMTFQQVSDRIVSLLSVRWQFRMQKIIGHFIVQRLLQTCFKLVSRSAILLLQTSSLSIKSIYQAIHYLSKGWKGCWFYFYKGWAAGLKYLS